MGLYSLLRSNDRFTIFFQNGNVIRDDLPSGFGVNGAITVSHDIPHGFDLPPRDSGMLRSKLVCQLTHQFSNLQNTEGCGIAIDRISLKNFSIIPEPFYCLLDLLAVRNDVLQDADIAVKRLHTTVPRHHEWSLKSVGPNWW